MKKLLKKLTAAVLSAAMTAALVPSAAVYAEGEGALPVRQLIERVNDYWISHNLTAPGYDWANAAYFVGNTQAYLITAEEAYRNYALLWGKANNWAGPGGADTGVWTKSGVFHADNQTCFQTYIDLYFLDGDKSKIDRALEVMDSQIHSAPNFYWDWDDALFMAMPVMSRLYRVTGDRLYADKLYAYFSACRDALYDREYHLFFRDGGYVNSTVEGQKNFWARGNGWVMAALAQTLRDMPENWEHYGDMLTVFQELAAGAAACMKDDGMGNKYWTQSMLPKYPVSQDNPNGYETSGTAFMTFALLYGINAGLLDESVYLPYALGGINYLENIAIQPDGLVGYVQEVGAAATVATAKTSTQNFGVGAALLALCEYYKYQGGLESGNYLPPYMTWRLNNTAVMRTDSGSIYYGGEIKPAPAPYREGDIWLPLRALAETLGYAVEWDSAGFASVYDGDESVILAPGSASARRNGAAVSLSAPVAAGDGGLYISASSIPAVFDRQVEVKDELVYVGYKLRNLLPCEASVERLLVSSLTAGALQGLTARAATKDFKYIASQNGGSSGSQLSVDRFQPLEELIDFAGALKIAGVSAASVPQAENPPSNAFDNDISTRYAAIEFNAVFDLGEVKRVSDIALSFWQYEIRTTKYELLVSADGVNYVPVYSGDSVMGRAFDRHRVDMDIRYVKVIGHGSSNGNWTSLLEIIPFEGL